LRRRPTVGKDITGLLAPLKENGHGRILIDEDAL
jgi:hypothetical protein